MCNLHFFEIYIDYIVDPEGRHRRRGADWSQDCQRDRYHLRSEQGKSTNVSVNEVMEANAYYSKVATSTALTLHSQAPADAGMKCPCRIRARCQVMGRARCRFEQS
jgi:hypothetical protein